jgi:hypothetical protein
MVSRPGAGRLRLRVENEGASLIRGRLHRSMIFATVVCLIGGATLATAGISLNVMLGGLGNSPGGRQAFSPREWIGERFPLLETIDIAEEIANGDWIILVIHHDCPRCADAANKLAGSAASQAFDSDTPRLAFVELPPYGELPSFAETKAIRHGHVGPGDYSIETPLAAQLIDGIVVGLIDL